MEQAGKPEETLDVAEIMRQIRETLARRRAEHATAAPLFPEAIGLPGEAAAGGLGEGAQKALQQARYLAEDIYVDYPIEWRNPLWGRAWAIFRRKIHNEVRTYVDAMVARQMAFNTAVTLVLEAVSGQLPERAALQAEVAGLREQVAGLERRLAELEARTNSR